MTFLKTRCCYKDKDLLLNTNNITYIEPYSEHFTATYIVHLTDGEEIYLDKCFYKQLRNKLEV